MRVMRAKVDMVSAPRAIDGMIRDCSESAPEVGSQPSATPNSRISRMPDQKVGRLWPVSTKPASARSSDAAAPDRHDHAGGNADAECDQQRTGRERHRVGDALGHDAGDAGALNEALAEIEPREVGEIGDVLHQQRAVEAEGVAQLRRSARRSHLPGPAAASDRRRAA